MTAAYDEWARARIPSLLAFAAALVDDPGAGEAAVDRALARVGADWPRVSRDDPDLVARRHVVRGCATSRRAAVVLRVLEDRSDAEIAAVLGCSEAAVRRQLQRGAGDVERGLAARDQILARAGGASTQLLTRPPRGEHRTERRSALGPWGAVAAVLALVGGVAYGVHQNNAAAGVIHYPTVQAPPSWRVESYDGVQLQVPGTWGWGASPLRLSAFTGPGHLGSCGTSQASVLSVADPSSASQAVGFVGRPAKVVERCIPWGSDGTMPTSDAVWFDSPLPVGQKSLPGTVAETRSVGGQRVTVFAPAPALRRQILGTAREVDVDGNGCPTQAVVRPTRGPAELRPDALSVCVYSQSTGVSALLYSAKADATVAAEYAAAGRAAATGGSCSTPNGTWVALGLTGDDGVRWDVVDIGCDRIQTAGGRSVALSPETVRAWAGGGVTAYVGAPAGDAALTAYFRAPTA